MQPSLSRRMDLLDPALPTGRYSKDPTVLAQHHALVGRRGPHSDARARPNMEKRNGGSADYHL